MSDNEGRWRCVVVGCNPVLLSEEAMTQHKQDTKHRTAKWPVRSEAGKAKARKRNRSGYYDKYNIGYKSRRPASWASDYVADRDYYEVHPFSEEAFSEGM